MRVTAALVVTAALAGVLSAQSPARDRQPEARSLFGEPLYGPEPPPQQKAKLEADFAGAKAAYDRKPNDAETIIWLGRRLGYLGRFREAIETYATGIRLDPSNPRLYRHRGHRYITVRELDKAIADLEQASSLIKGQPDEIELDGAPNKFNKPRSTLQANIWYHLALARYLTGDFTRAVPAYLECMKVSTNDDMRVATADWLYMTYRRLGRTAEAAKLLEPIHERMDILENTAYHRRLLMYKGLLKPEQVLDPNEADPVQIATQGYGVGNWYLYNAQIEQARQIFEKVRRGSAWAAFGFIAAEADLKRGLASRER